MKFPGGPDSDPVLLDANWLLAWSHHVLYTNMVEPLLRFILAARGYALLHCAAVDAEHGAIVMSAQTDTGKTSAVLRLLMHHSWGFLSDDMAIVGPGRHDPLVSQADDPLVAHDERGQRADAAVRRPGHARRAQPGPLEAGPLDRPFARPGERADRHDQRLGPAPRAAAEVPRHVARRLRDVRLRRRSTA